MKTSLLYRAWSADGDLLYIGVTDDLDTRKKQHESLSPWCSEVSAWTSTKFNHRHDANLAEAQAIVAERPIYNVTHNKKVEWAGTDLSARFVAEVRAEMGRQNLSQSQLARLSGLAQENISRKLRGTREFTLGEYLTICDALGVGITEFAERVTTAALRSEAAA